MKIIPKILLVLSVLILLIVGFGIYKFNFSKNNIFTEETNKIDLENQIPKTEENAENTGENSQNIKDENISENTKLSGKTWIWVNTIYSNDTEVKPLSLDKFSITFKEDNTFSAKTDCNNMGGNYTQNANKISFSEIFSTKMFCENSQEELFSKMLQESQSYLLNEKGYLVLSLKLDSGSMFFK